jgi:hypothetical protein
MVLMALGFPRPFLKNKYIGGLKNGKINRGTNIKYERRGYIIKANGDL